MFQIIDSKTKEIVGTYSSLSRATRRADKLDNEYGGYRYRVEPVGGYQALAAKA